MYASLLLLPLNICTCLEIVSMKALKNSLFFVFVCLLHPFCAVTMSDTRVEALPIMYRQSRTDLPLSTDLNSVFYSSCMSESRSRYSREVATLS